VPLLSFTKLKLSISLVFWLIDVDSLFNRKDGSLSCIKEGEYLLLVISILPHLQLIDVMQDLILKIMSEFTTRIL